MSDYPRHLILASASPYRRELLERIVPGFEIAAADIDESAHPGEAPADLAVRLAADKAAAVAAIHPEAIVIGSDQVAARSGKLLSKPGSAANAIRQLGECSGRRVMFYTAVSISGPGFAEQHLDTTTVDFRELQAAEIERYVERDEPWNCAGSFRAEGLGPTLFKSILSHDPTALIGLPLIWVAGSLRRAGWTLP